MLCGQEKSSSEHLILHQNKHKKEDGAHADFVFTFKFKSVSQLKPNIEEPSTEGEKRDLVKIMHAIGASISQPTADTDRSAFKTKIDKMSGIQVALKNSDLKVYAATKATVQLVFGYKKTDSGVQALGRLQIVPSGSIPKASIIISQFLIKDNIIGGLSKKESSSIAKILSNIDSLHL